MRPVFLEGPGTEVQYPVSAHTANYSDALTAREVILHTGFVGLFFNGCLVSAFIAFFIAQTCKVFTHYYTEQVYTCQNTRWRVWGIRWGERLDSGRSYGYVQVRGRTERLWEVG